GRVEGCPAHGIDAAVARWVEYSARAPAPHVVLSGLERTVLRTGFGVEVIVSDAAEQFEPVRDLHLIGYVSPDRRRIRDRRHTGWVEASAVPIWVWISNAREVTCGCDPTSRLLLTFFPCDVHPGDHAVP